jgi:RsiW-degrading membrane proteinase PrsW (M82 family)
MLPLFVALTVPLILIILLVEDRYSKYLLLFFSWGVGAGLASNLIETLILAATDVQFEKFSIQLAPLIEELLKILPLLVLLLINTPLVKDKNIILYTLFAGIGFSIIENFYYLTRSGLLSVFELALFVFTRSVSTSIMHALTSGFIGFAFYYFYTKRLNELSLSWILLFSAYSFSVIFHALFNLYVQFSAFGESIAISVSLLLYLIAWLLFKKSRGAQAAS